MVVVALEGAERYDLFSTSVVFRSGSLVVAVSASHADAADRLAQVERVARAAIERLAAVRAGEITEPARVVAQLPDRLAPSAPAEAPVDAPDLAAIAVAPRELPVELRLLSEGYVDPDGSVALYDNEYEAFDTATIGTSEVFGLGSTIGLASSEAEAVFVFEIAAAALTAEGGVARLLGIGIAEVTSASVSFVDEASAEIDDIAERTVSARVTVELPEGSVDALFIVFQRGPIVGTLYAIGTAYGVYADDIIPLARAMDKRAARALDAGA